LGEDPNFIKTENILEDGSIGKIEAFIDKETNEFLKLSILHDKDILFSIAGTIGRVGVVFEKNIPANTNQALAIIRSLCDHLHHPYIFYFLKSPFIQMQALKSIVGVARANISLTDVGNFPLPLPPLPEQHRIVAKIEELFTKLDAAVEALKRVKAQLKRYRQAVLKYAFEGKLTQEWREANKDKLEPASVLLERIKEERKKNAGGKFKKLPPVNITDSPELPKGWGWARVGQIGSVLGGKWVPKGHVYSESLTNHPYIRVTDFEKFSININNLVFLKPETHKII
jgi:type I restriction enzyme S subunit